MRRAERRWKAPRRTMLGQCLIQRSRHEIPTRRKQSTLLFLFVPTRLAPKVAGKSVNTLIQTNSGIQKGDCIPVTFVGLAGFVALLLPRTHTVEMGFQRVDRRVEFMPKHKWGTCISSSASCGPRFDDRQRRHAVTPFYNSHNISCSRVC